MGKFWTPKRKLWKPSRRALVRGLGAFIAAPYVAKAQFNQGQSVGSVGFGNSVASGGGGYVAGAVHFADTAALYCATALTGAADGPHGTYFVWFRIDPSWVVPGAGTPIFLSNSVDLTGGGLPSTNIYNYMFLAPEFPTPENNVVYAQLTDESYANDIGAYCGNNVADGNWHLWTVSWSTDHAAGLRVVQMLLDKTLQTVTIDFEDGGSFDVVWDDPITIGRGGFDSLGAPSFPHNPIEMSDQYLNITTAVDLSDSATIAKIIDADGKPVSLGSDGSLLTGSVPNGGFYLSGDASTYANNLAGTGIFTVFGALTDAPTSPSG